MALYRTGTAAMDAQGVITGTGTKWREPLSLIRTGATIVFLTTPLKLAVISDIVSDTEMKAIQTDGEPVANGNYVILLNDSLTVDGMAQDVAETLRYYQSKETVIEEAIEFFKNFDLKTLQDLVARAEASAQKTDADRAATEQLKNDTQAIKDAAVNETQQIKDAAVDETNQIKADTNAIKDQTQQIKDSAVTEITGIKNEALDARDEAENAQFAAEQSKVGADSAKAGAETARDEARQWAQQVNPENLLHKDQNLNDLANKDLAREALKVEAVNSVKDQATGAYNSFRNPAWTYELRIANNGEWRVSRNSDNSTSALSIGAGGTGAENVTQAKINLQIDRFVPVGQVTSMLSGNKTRSIIVGDTGEWGGFNEELQSYIPLGVAQGGTGAISVDGARYNLGLATNHSPVFGGIDLQGLNGTTSGIMVLRNRDAGGTQVTYSRVYNELQSGVSKTTIQTTKEGGDTNYYQFDEHGNAVNYNSITIGRGIGNALGDNSLAIGDTDTGLKWASDGVFNVFCNSKNVMAFAPTALETFVPIGYRGDDRSRCIYSHGTRVGGENAFIAGVIEQGGHVAWRDRAAGILIELTARDAAANIWKCTKWGEQHACASDIVIYGDGSPMQRILVGGAEYHFNSSGVASATSWVSTSDIRLKAQLKEIKTAKEKVKSIKGYTYFKRNNLDEDEHSIYSEEAGVIAQDVQAVLPESVYKISNSDYLGVSYSGVTALLVNAINEMIDDADKHNETIQTQQEEIKELKNEIAEMKTAIAEMQAMFVQLAK